MPFTVRQDMTLRIEGFHLDLDPVDPLRPDSTNGADYVARVLPTCFIFKRIPLSFQTAQRGVSGDLRPRGLEPQLDGHYLNGDDRHSGERKAGAGCSLVYDRPGSENRNSGGRLATGFLDDKDPSIC